MRAIPLIGLSLLASPAAAEVVSAGPNGVSFWSDTTGSDFTGPAANGDPGTVSNPRPVLRTLSYSGGVLTEQVRATAGGTVLHPAATLHDQKVQDGEVLYLRVSQQPARS